MLTGLESTVRISTMAVLHDISNFCFTSVTFIQEGLWGPNATFGHVDMLNAHINQRSRLCSDLYLKSLHI